MVEVVSIGEKGQIVIPKKMRDDFKLEKGVQLIILEENNKIVLKPIKMDDKMMLMLLSEASLKKTWNNKFDDRWDDVF